MPCSHRGQVTAPRAAEARIFAARWTSLRSGYTPLRNAARNRADYHSAERCSSFAGGTLFRQPEPTLPTDPIAISNYRTIHS